MDSLALVQVARALDRDLRGAALRAVRQEGAQRIRLTFERFDRSASILLSVHPRRPWVGRAAPLAKPGPTPFSAAIAARLRGRIVTSIEKAPLDRLLRMSFAGGDALLAELVPGAPNIVVVDGGGLIIAAARSGGPRREVRAGAPYVAPPPQAGLLDAFGQSASAIDAILEEAGPMPDDPLVLLRRRLGLGTGPARLVLEEALRTANTVGQVLARRLGEFASAEPVIEAPFEPGALTGEEWVDIRSAGLLPWEPDWPPEAGSRRTRGSDASETAGLYYGTLERIEALEQRARGLTTIVRREIDRLAEAERRARADRDAFEDPARHRRWGEALLAGASSARRCGESIVVPDPYDAEGPAITVPAKPGLGTPAAAKAHFHRARRAERGIESATRRGAALAARRAALQRVAESFPEQGAPADLDGIEAQLRTLGIPVGLEPSRGGARRTRVPAVPPRLERVRIATSLDGLALLIGKSGADNQRLTFRIAAPEDFWFHVLGRSGAHVVVRNPLRSLRPPARTLAEAAAAAAWYSEARPEGWVDVQWTRCKNVRRVRGAPPGTVRLKRFEVVRVRPAPIGTLDETPTGQPGR